MDYALEPLLWASAQASAENLTMRTWQLTNIFALHYWTDEPKDVAANLPSDIQGDYWLLRAAVAENVGRINDAAMAYAQLLELGEGSGKLAKADLAWANLCFLQPGEEALGHLADRLSRWCSGGFHDVSSTDAALITSAAMLGYTAEVGTQSANTERIALFVNLAEAYGSNNPTQADRLLWRAQQSHGAGDTVRAKELAREVIAIAQRTNDAVAEFEGHDMLGNLALMEVHEPEVALHFSTCFNLLEHREAPVLALQRAATAAWAGFSAGQVEFAAQLATAALATCDRMPSGSVQRDLLTVLGNCALERGDEEEAAMWAERVRERH